jgi:voltage-gated potassium channel
MNLIEKKQSGNSWRAILHEIIFEADTPAGKLFDIALLWCITLSVLTAMLESVASINQHYSTGLRTAEWIFTILFTIEYVLRIISVQKPWRYISSFFGIIDLLAVVPTYLSLFIAGSQGLIAIRAVRLLRVFRVFKFARYSVAARNLIVALRASKPKIIVFFGAVLSLVISFGALMYLIEGQANGFTSIPRSVYWAVVTLTTVGYGDITPQTTIGQLLSAVVMVLGYAIIAVPTGIISVELARTTTCMISTQACKDCGQGGHDPDARFCKFCGGEIVSQDEELDTERY